MTQTSNTLTPKVSATLPGGQFESAVPTRLMCNYRDQSRCIDLISMYHDLYNCTYRSMDGSSDATCGPLRGQWLARSRPAAHGGYEKTGMAAQGYNCFIVHCEE